MSHLKAKMHNISFPHGLRPGLHWWSLQRCWWQLCRAFNCRILYDHYLPTVILIIIGIPSPTHSFPLGSYPSFSANPPYRSLSFLSFKIHYLDFPDCLLLYTSEHIRLFTFFLFLHFFSCRFRAVD